MSAKKPSLKPGGGQNVGLVVSAQKPSLKPGGGQNGGLVMSV